MAQKFTGTIEQYPVRIRRSGKQCVDERLRVEGFQVLRLLPRADQLNRDAELVLDRDDDTAAGGAVEFGQDQTGDVDGGLELLGLANRILARGGVEDEQRLVGGASVAAALQNAVDLLELFHQVRLVVQ